MIIDLIALRNKISPLNTTVSQDSPQRFRKILAPEKGVNLSLRHGKEHLTKSLSRNAAAFGLPALYRGHIMPPQINGNKFYRRDKK